ncbi:MAG: thioredoxin domain-containing protein [Planctomycetales bacterium]|nr:thioredoxin domain-containing protein [Planctomycetales bacterium]
MPNRLANSSSPYLLQHKDNPVDWYPWGQEAFDRAKRENKPIFLSVGYAACHWCHVMEHESFENPELAAIMNERFVCVKVDREERPDVDQIYMQAVQMLTGSGGWPMSVFLNHDRKPFYGGTYWPPDSRYGRPGFGQVLLAVSDAWENRRDQLESQSEEITQHLKESCAGPSTDATELDSGWLAQADNWLWRNHDAKHGGFGTAPKFPHAMDLSLLVEMDSLSGSANRRNMIELTLDKMRQGGIYDHLGGGFARYSVDARWLVPHFEKMLYDNALLVVVYADAYRLWRTEPYAQVVRETLDYVLRDMTHELGGFYSTEDADSEGVEGKFYVWQKSEIEAILGTEASFFCSCYDVSDAGNFEHANILNLPKPLEQLSRELGIALPEMNQRLEASRQKLLAVRNQRVRPGLDDKVLLSWNALMVEALVHGYRATSELKYLEAARTNIRFLRKYMRDSDGRLHHTWRQGVASLSGYLDDYSYLIQALLALFQVDSRAEYLEWATELANIVLTDFQDTDGSLFFTSHTHEELIARSKDVADSSVPSASGMAALALWNLSRLTSREDYRQASERVLTSLAGVMSSSPQASGQALRALQRSQAPYREEILLSPAENSAEFQAAKARLLLTLAPTSLTIAVESSMELDRLVELCPMLSGKRPLGSVTLFRCQDSVCEAPLHGPQIMEELSRAPN